jgi:hypothetical protein
LAVSNESDSERIAEAIENLYFVLWTMCRDEPFIIEEPLMNLVETLVKMQPTNRFSSLMREYGRDEINSNNQVLE